MAPLDGSDASGSSARPRPKRATILDVAERAGVSRSTASRALTGNGYVAESALGRVLAAAEELGYLPDVAARSFRHRRSTSIGLLVSDIRTPLHSQIAAGVCERLASDEYTLLVAHTPEDPARHLEAARSLAARRTDGVIITPLGGAAASFFQRLGIPVVEVDGLPSDADCDRVLPDSRTNGVLLLEHVLAGGHRRIALVIDDNPTASQLDFVGGAEDAARAAGLATDDVQVLRTSSVTPAAHAEGPLSTCTAILTGSAAIAEVVIVSRRDAPALAQAEIALASFGEAPWMGLVDPAVTALRTDGTELGVRAAERMLHRLMHPDEPFLVERLPGELIVRGTTRASHDGPELAQVSDP